jgi:inner membrane protein
LDNVTHTLIGALLGESAARFAPTAGNERQTRLRRGMFLAVAIVGSNFPDADLLFTLGSNGKLAYLLEHRGHTHTVVGALLISLAMLGACALWRRWRNVPLSTRDRGWLVALALLAPLLHIAMDALNTYGVHPWWPFDNRWFYGDAVFIVEPLFWAAAAPLVFLFRSYVARALVALALVAGLYLAFVTGIVVSGSIAFYCLLVVAMLALGRYAAPAVALATAIGVCVLTTAVFAVASREAAGRVDGYAAQYLHDWTIVDRVLTPLPMNPFCWELILIESNERDYALRRAIVSLAPSRMASLQCPMRSMMGAITAPLRRVAAPDTAVLHWQGEMILSRDALRDLARTSCEAAALLRFARAPWYAERGDERVIGDLRYDREPGLGFAEIDLAHPARCPGYVPPRVPPRSDLLR